MPTSKDIANLNLQIKKTLITSQSFKKQSSFDTSKSILGIHKNISTLAGSIRKVVIRVGALEKVVQNNSRKITSLKNISALQGPQIRGTNIGAKLPGNQSDNLNKDISVITDAVSSIAETLKQQYKNDEKTSEYNRRKAEQEKRGLAESKLEKTFDGIKKIAQRIIAPVKSLLDRILDFFKTVILGRIVYKLVEWFGDPKNADKVKSVIRFVKDWWPALLASYILFGNSFSGLIRGTLGMVARFSIQLARVAIPRLLSVIAANPITSAIVIGATAAGIGAYQASEQNKRRRDEFSRTDRSTVTPEQTAKTGKTPGTRQLQQEQILQRGFGGMFNGGGLAKFRGGGFAEGYVSGERGVDKVPAMLSDGEFVMSVGAVEKYGVDTLEAMNAAGGGTNKPKIVGGKTYAAGGGYIGDTVQKLREDINDYLKGKGGGPNFDIGNPRTWFPAGGGTSVSGGGGTGGFLGGLGYIGRAANQVPKTVSSTINPAVSYAQRAAGQASKIVSPALSYTQRAAGQASKMVSPALSYAQRVAGEAKKKVDPVINSILGFRPDLSGIQTLGSNIQGAATEALPALLSSTIGLSRTDKSISQDMQRALLQARQNAKGRGRDYVDYKDYIGGGLSAGGLTFGRIGNSEWKRDAKGRIIGIRQIYDTNRSAKEAMEQAGQSWNAFTKSGGKDIGSLGRAAYKPFEAWLAKVQNRGLTMHDINFDEKVLGFKPGQEVLNPTQKRMISAQRNRETLQNKRPWWDKMGLFGGASAEMKRQRERESAAFSKSGGYGRYTAGPSQKRIKPVGPPVSRKPRVVYGPPVPAPKGGAAAKPAGSRVPKFTPYTKGTRTTVQTLGLLR